jgi:hypothetical protein
MKDNIKILESYSNTFRDLVTDRNPKGPIKDALRLSREEDWSFIRGSMDIIDDASLALKSFLKFGLDGPTKYNDVGEVYLRLYGMLSAIFIQKRAILTLHELNTDSNSKDASEKIDALKIIEVRHKIAAHACDYQNRSGEGKNKLESYVPIRLHWYGFNIKLINSENGEIEKIPLKDYLEEYIILMISFLDQIIEKSIKRIFRGNEKKKNEFNKKLEHLRIERDGGIVIEMENVENDKTTIVVLGSPYDRGEKQQNTEN